MWAGKISILFQCFAWAFQADPEQARMIALSAMLACNFPKIVHPDALSFSSGLSFERSTNRGNQARL
jgi:hypothetical protein